MDFYFSICITIVESFKKRGKNPPNMYLTLLQINKAESQEEITSCYTEYGHSHFLEIEIKQMHLLKVPKSYAAKPWLILVN